MVYVPLPSLYWDLHPCYTPAMMLLMMYCLVLELSADLWSSRQQTTCSGMGILVIISTAARHGCGQVPVPMPCSSRYSYRQGRAPMPAGYGPAGHTTYIYKGVPRPLCIYMLLLFPAMLGVLVLTLPC